MTFKIGDRWFIVGIDTPEGSYTYHTEKDVTRLLSLSPAQPEPCEDAVSREAVLDKAWDAPYEGRYIQVVSVGDIEELPPVTPSHKKGKWVKVTNGRGGHECNICHAYAPSYQNGDEYLSRFCPNCGAKMDQDKHHVDSN